VEQDCLDFLLKGTQPVVVVPARGPYSVVPRKLRAGLEQDRLTIVYPFGAEDGRQTAALAGERNKLVDALSAALFVIYAHKDSETLARAFAALDRGKPVYTFDIPENEPLVARGAQGIEPEVVRDPDALHLALSWPVAPKNSPSVHS
jgi:predicted Rossmann fold nucleotide-binding protein DprA/Smf involved in DNA uptake